MRVALPVLALDVGGTKLAAALVDADGSLRNQRRVPTTHTGAGEAEALWVTVHTLLEAVRDGEEIAGVGVGCGGPMTGPEGEVSPLNIPAWRDFPLCERIAAVFPDRPVRLVNDAIAMAIGENWRGAGSGSRALLGVVVSTGVGGGLVLDGRAVMGTTGNAGHIGHVVVDPDGPDCACGGRGCLEAVARGPALLTWAVAQGWRPADGATADGPAMLAAARHGDAVAIAAYARAGTALGRALASAAHLLELDRVVIGGGVANAGELLLDPARATFNRHARMTFAAGCQLVVSDLGGQSGLLGAAALVAAGDRYWTGGGH